MKLSFFRLKNKGHRCQKQGCREVFTGPYTAFLKGGFHRECVSDYVGIFAVGINHLGGSGGMLAQKFLEI